MNSVANIYAYMKKNGYATVVMGASFRTKDQVFFFSLRKKKILKDMGNLLPTFMFL